MHRTILFLTLSTLLLPISCQAAGFPKLFVATTTDKRVYKQSEPIAMALTVLNQNSKPLQVQFSSSRIYDFYLYDEQGQLVWKWSGDKMFAMSLVNLKLEPGKPLTYVITFNQVLPSGKLLEPGKYQLQGAFCPREKQYLSQPAGIEIRR